MTPDHIADASLHATIAAVSVAHVVFALVVTSAANAANSQRLEFLALPNASQRQRQKREDA